LRDVCISEFVSLLVCTGAITSLWSVWDTLLAAAGVINHFLRDSSDLNIRRRKPSFVDVRQHDLALFSETNFATINFISKLRIVNCNFRIEIIFSCIKLLRVVTYNYPM